MTARRILFALSAISIATVAMAGCASPTTVASISPTPSPIATGPLTVDNCGTSVTFATPPQRVVTIKSTSTEMLLALGLGKRIVGEAFQDGPVPDQWGYASLGIPVLAEKVPSEEVVLGATPDLVYAGWESAFAADQAGDRADLAKLGVATYVSPSACQSHNQPKKLTFDNIFSDISEVAAIFQVDPSSVIADQKKKLSAVPEIGDGRTAFWYSSGSDTPYAGAGIGAPELIMETVGLKNIAADVDATWAPYNWEAVVDADPSVIVLVDASWSTAAKKMGILESNPATANLTAVINHRYIILPFPTTEAGVRTVDAAADVAKQLAALDAP
ncbi:MAG: putative F420-0 ABC transporter substrate-binding protein [Rhodoglobus sp.]